MRDRSVAGFTGDKKVARVKLVDKLEPEDRYDLVLVAMQKSSRLAVCPILAENQNLENVLFLGNDVSGFLQYLDYLPEEKILLGFPGAGGGWDGDEVLEMMTEFAEPKAQAGLETPNLDELIACARQPQ